MRKTLIFKKALLVVMTLTIIATTFMVPGFIVNAAVTSPVTTITAPGSGIAGTPVTTKYSINEGWMFTETERGVVGDSNGNYPSESEYTWTEVDAPHTWWPTDTEHSTEAGEHTYHDGWYRKTVSVPESMKNGRVWIEFEAAGPGTRVWVDNAWIGEHYGGYTNFKFDISTVIKNKTAVDGMITVTISLKITDSTSYTPPVAGGFTKFPGITGNVNLIYTENVSVALTYDGGVDGTKLATSGIFVTPERADTDDIWGTEDDWTVEVESKLSNLGSATNVLVKTTLRAMDGFDNVVGAEFLDFDPATMSEDFSVTKEEIVTLSETLNDYSTTFDVKDPRLWNGRKDPFLYYADFEVYTEDGSLLLDKKTESFGFRTFEVTAEGAFLNGNHYSLRGVAYHEDIEGAGSGLTEEDWNETFKIAYELGENFVRLSHYPHDPYSYELCDRYGILVWAEIGLISQATPNYSGSTSEVMPQFVTRAQNHLKELIRQNKNRVSIVVWGIENELALNTISVDNMKEFVNGLIDMAHEEDPTRLTTQTAGWQQHWYDWDTDVTAFNVYPLWYINNNNNGTNSFEGQIAFLRQQLDKHGREDEPVGLAEYGAGANPNQHTEYPEQPNPTTSQFHPEEWQNVVHEEAITAFNNHPEVWISSVWNLFDFAEYTRNEGGVPGINDKGIVTRDRQTKKDSYYLYQANWVDADTYPVIHIASSKMDEREIPSNTVTVYSNLDKLELFRNNVSLGVVENDGNGIFKWDDVAFGDINETATYTAKSVDTEIAAKSGVSSVEWTRVASAQNEIHIHQDKVYLNETAGTITFAGTINAANINTVFTSRYNATIELVDASGNPVTEGTVEGGMKLRITAENGTVTEYIMYASSIAIGKDVSVSVGTNADKTIDGIIPENLTSITTDLQKMMWNPVSATGTITIDLKTVYTLNNITLHMYKAGNNRKYYYNIYVGETEDDMKLVVDRTGNTVAGVVSDSLDNIQGRYVMVEFTGNSGSGQIALYEIEISGYILSGTEVEIDNKNKVIYIPSEWTNENNMANFQNDVKVEGNAYITIETDKYYLEEGSIIVVNDITGGRTEYTIKIAEEPPYAGDTSNPFVWIAIMLVSGGVLVLAFFLGKKKFVK